MFWFIVCCILVVLAVGAFVLAPRIGYVELKRDRYSGNAEEIRHTFKNEARWTGSALAVLAAVVFLLDTVTTVGTKNVGVITTFGRPSGYLTNGIHFVLPWQQVTEISDAVQTDTYASDNGSDKPQGGATGTCVHVRIERQATACVNVSVRWQIKPSGVDYLYRNFKSNDHITDNLVLRDLQQALNEAFATYDPLGVDANGNNTNPALTTYSAKVQAQMRDEIGDWIDVQSVVVPIINYDATTQQKVNQLLQQIALTRVAEQSKQTALAQSEANKALAASVADDPNVLVSKCLDILKELVDKGRDLPAGFSCFGPSTNPIAVGGMPGK